MIQQQEWPPVPATPIIVPVDTLHSDLYPFCSDPCCPCHNDDELQADLGEALAEGRVKDGDAGAVYYGEAPLVPRAA